MGITTLRTADAAAVRPHFGWTARLTASWTLAGGVAGGVLSAGLVLLGRMHPDALLLLAGFFTAGGSALGTVHGAVLGHLGRPSRRHEDDSSVGAMLIAAVAAFAGALLLSWLLTVSATVARAGSTTGWIVFLPAAALALGTLATATVLGWHALENAYRHWPDHRLGSWLTAGAFVVLLVMMLALRPAVPGTEVRLSALGSVVLAALAAVWIAGPAVILGLRLVHHGDRGGTGSAQER